MLAYSVFIGSRDTTYKDKEVYIVKGIGQFKYTKNESGTVKTGKLKITDTNYLYNDAYTYCYKLIQYSMINGSFMVVDKDLNRIAGDHCVRLPNEKSKYEIGPMEVSDTDGVWYNLNEIKPKDDWENVSTDLADYGIAIGEEYDYLNDPFPKISCSLAYHLEDGIDSVSARLYSGVTSSTNAGRIWIDGYTIRIEIINREFTPKGWTSFMWNGLDKCHLIEGATSAWYRIHCFNTVSQLSQDIYGRECYVGDIDYLRETLMSKILPSKFILIDKEFVDRVVEKIRYIAIEGVFIDNEYYFLICYDLVDKKTLKINREMSEKLLKVGKLVIPLESISILNGKNSTLEYVPLPSGEFINKQGNIITYQEMEKYFLDKYGYFIDLYNGYKWELVREFNYFSLAEMKYTRLEEVADVMGDKAIYATPNKFTAIMDAGCMEMLALKIKMDAICDKNTPAWVTVENMRGNEIEIRHRQLVMCDIKNSIVLRDIDGIQCEINKMEGSGDITVTIQGDVKVNKCLDEHIKYIVDNENTFKHIGDNLWSMNVVYKGDTNKNVVKYIIEKLYDRRSTGLPTGDWLELQSNGYLSYEDTYTVLMEIYNELLEIYIYRGGDYKEFMEFIRDNGIDTCRVNKDAVEDIIKDFAVDSQQQEERSDDE